MICCCCVSGFRAGSLSALLNVVERVKFKKKLRGYLQLNCRHGMGIIVVRGRDVVVDGGVVREVQFVEEEWNDSIASGCEERGLNF